MEDVLEEELKLIKSEIIDKYYGLNLRASGNFERELEIEVTQKANKLSGKIKGVPYTSYTEYGRASGKRPPIEALKGWIQSKGIVSQSRKRISVTSLAFAIATKIGQEGTKRFKTQGQPPFIAGVVTPERVQQIIEKVGRVRVFSFKVEILNFLMQIKRY